MKKKFLKVGIVIMIGCSFVLVGCKSEKSDSKTNSSSGNKKESELSSEKQERTEVYGMHSPEIMQDTVTWDCIWFGSYPQYQAYITDNRQGWENEEKEIDGKKYRELDKSSATRKFKGEGYFSWENIKGEIYFSYSPIKWRILSIKEDKALLLAEKILDYQPCGSKEGYNVTWETSAIRSWLNAYGADCNADGIDYLKDNFINFAFSETEAEAIIKTKIKNNEGDTEDKVFLLSEEEVYKQEYGFGIQQLYADPAREAVATTYARAMGLSWATTVAIGNSGWHLRTGHWIDNIGYINEDDLSDECSIRPAIVIDLSKTSCYYNAGTVCSDGTVVEIPYNANLTNTEYTNESQNK